MRTSVLAFRALGMIIRTDDRSIGVQERKSCSEGVDLPILCRYMLCLKLD